MNAEVIAIGDELLIGQVTDTNSDYIAKRLNLHGVELLRVTRVRDRAGEITAAVNESLSRVPVVLLTGGLGPTKDDITKITLCGIFGGKLVYSPETQASNDALFARQGKEMNELTRRQAMLPDVCTVIPNPIGTAPGMLFRREGKILVSMPGVPFEMRNMMENGVLPIIDKAFPCRGYIMHATKLVSGFTESRLATYLNDYEASLPETVKLAYLPNMGIIRLRLTVRGSDKEEVASLLSQYSGSLTLLLAGHIVSETDMTPGEALGTLLKARGYTLSTAESCTGGNVAARIVAAAGASQYYKGGLISYDNSVKTNELGVPAKDLEAFGAVSDTVARSMARGVAMKLSTDCAIATSGVAGPDGGTAEKPVGTVAISVYRKGEEITRTVKFPPADREKNIERFTSAALTMMIELLMREGGCRTR